MRGVRAAFGATLMLGTVACGVAAFGLAACGGRSDSDRSMAESGRVAETKAAIGGGASMRATITPDSALQSLASSAGGDGTVYRPTRDTTLLHAGSIVGRVSSPKTIVGDTAIDPTHDLSVCKPFTETIVPQDKQGIGNAVVWLVGVETGPEQTSPRRVTLTLDRCRLDPRVLQVAQGSTLLVTSRDAMMSRLRFLDLSNGNTQRAQITLNDAGQVVPTSDVAAKAGLVEVRDDLHPWVRAYLAVSPHPFVSVTDADGAFTFTNVPSGIYTMVVWQEKLGAKTRTVRVTTGVETRVVVEY